MRSPEEIAWDVCRLGCNAHNYDLAMRIARAAQLEALEAAAKVAEDTISNSHISKTVADRIRALGEET